MTPTGLFITLEGLDGAGKSSHVDFLVQTCSAQGQTVVRTREPGGTPLGEALRGLLLSYPMAPETEALLMFAARQEHIIAQIRPALARGHTVICDRFTDASFAYQGGGRGLPAQRLSLLEHWVQQGLEPDISFFFDLPVALARERLNQDGRAKDRFEEERFEFFERVRAAYLDRARGAPGRIRVIDAAQTREAVADELRAHLRELGLCS
jgi:dTMP kinase